MKQTLNTLGSESQDEIAFQKLRTENRLLQERVE